MALMRIQNSVPEIYENSSRDFQLISRLYDTVFCGVKYDIDSMINIIDTSEIKSSILQLLQGKLGFFTDANIQDDYLRKILIVFPELIKYKGCKKGIDKAINLFMHLQHKIIDYLILDYISEDGDLYIILNTPISNLTLLDEILKYILPTGISVKYISALKTDNSFELGEHISILNTNSIVDSNIKIKLSEFGEKGATNINYIIQDAELITSDGNISQYKEIIPNKDFDQMLNSVNMTAAHKPIDVYNSELSYNENDLAIYNNALYICTATTEISGAWDSAYWSVIDENSVYISSTDINQFNQSPPAQIETTMPYLFKQTPNPDQSNTLSIQNIFDDSVVNLMQSAQENNDEISLMGNNEINDNTEQSIQSYNSSNVYNIGDQVTRYRVIYTCLDNNVTGTWDSSKWERDN